jgi:hypothetical protein
VSERPHDTTLNVSIPLPDDFDLVDRVRYESPDRMGPMVPIGEIRQLHDLALEP